MNTELLLKLADMLEADAANPSGLMFDMDVVVDIKDEVHEKLLGSPTPNTIPVSCGTQACAMGLAALSGKFEGLSYKIFNEPFSLEGYRFDIRLFLDGSDIAYDDAAMKIFGLSERQAHYLFNPSYYDYDTPTTGAEGENYVAFRIRDLVKKKGKLPEDILTRMFLVGL